MTNRNRAAAVIGVVVGIPTLVALGVYGWLFACSMYWHPTRKHLIELLFLWQAQTGAMLAIAAAVLGAGAVVYQTEVTQRLEKTRRTRRTAALRAVLLPDFMDLSDYAKNCGTTLADALARHPKIQSIYDPGLQLPPLPDGLVSRLTELIEQADSDHAGPLIALVRRLQIQHARAREIQTRAANRHGKILLWTNLTSGVIDAAEIQARCGKLFEYARGNATVPAAEIAPANVSEAVFWMCEDLSGDIREELEKSIKDRTDIQNGSGWLEA